VSAFRTDVFSLVTSAMLGASGAEFWVSSIKKSIDWDKVLVAATSGQTRECSWLGAGQRMSRARKIGLVSNGRFGSLLSDCRVFCNAA
jgi:hypothetical protein